MLASLPQVLPQRVRVLVWPRWPAAVLQQTSFPWRGSHPVASLMTMISCACSCFRGWVVGAKRWLTHSPSNCGQTLGQRGGFPLRDPLVSNLRHLRRVAGAWLHHGAYLLGYCLPDRSSGGRERSLCHRPRPLDYSVLCSMACQEYRAWRTLGPCCSQSPLLRSSASDRLWPRRVA